MRSHYYMSIPSPFGIISVVWREAVERPRIKQSEIAPPKVTHIFLSNEQVSAQDRVQATFPDTTCGSDPTITELAEQIQCFLEGQAVAFDLASVDMKVCSPFQRRVLLAEYEIPRGWVSTYGKIAKHIGVVRGARAVGGALARNPFPIIIPCHRAIRSDGIVGGYQGGLRMKRALLELEGVAVSERGKVLSPKLYF